MQDNPGIVELDTSFRIGRHGSSERVKKTRPEVPDGPEPGAKLAVDRGP